MRGKYLGELLGAGILLNETVVEDQQVKRIDYDSRKVEDMSLFVAIKGYSTDGHDYIRKAREKGAVAAVVEHENPEIEIAQYVVKDSRSALAKIASRFYGPEIQNMRLVGITGTNGKTTISFLIRSILNTAGFDSGLIGTIHYDVGGKLTKAWNTTPESVDLYEMLYHMSLKGQNSCVLEASSHGLSLHRLDYLDFEVAVFTNLSQDHLDFHKDFEDYFQAKKILFSSLKTGAHAIINSDDPYGRRLLNEVRANIVDFGLSPQASIHPESWHSSLQGINAELKTPSGEIRIRSSLIGKFNVENILAAVAVGIAMKIELNTIKTGIEAVTSVPGRLEPVPFKDNKTVVVDYSHTPDALQKALLELKEITENELWVVFGCGGDRDKKKRPLMGKIADEIAHRVVVTSDNPRSESPETIIGEILLGIQDQQKIEVEANRRLAIKQALQNSVPGDTILVAGKGHEDYQEIMGIKHPFDDRQVIRDFK